LIKLKTQPQRHAFTLAEEWESQATLDRHLTSSAYKTLVAAIELSAQPPAIRFDSVAHRAGIEVIEAARGIGEGA
jgi:quinol monooxygenase YgiN